MKIGELAKQCGLLPGTVRYYEKAGLMPSPKRNDANYRHYGEAHVERLRFIQHCRSLDMSLDEIRLLLDYRDRPDASCGGVGAIIDEHISHVARRIEELRQLEMQLRALKSHCAGTGDVQDCGILNALAGSAFGDKADSTHAGCTHMGSVHTTQKHR
ncbi:MAG: Cd(II)/Pb(II)-responsive transcriptional regulator [Oxalobacter sp.]|jgi:Cd(II)/Pb(II)-responsive transcriptional regulator|nr:Cd(II)/Pb(II)-responsive transcriptional regulator [Oxalobacter sp.]